jgi:MerR family transcriptional regulator, redox-sensitive transcriptional activator SoxR
MADFTIGEVARRSGLRPSAIRYYESQGILPAPRRINRRRRYDDDVLYFLKAVQIARLAGFTIAEMRQLFQGIQQDEAPSAVWRRFAEDKLREVDALIDRAQAMKLLLHEGLRCGCLGWDDCVLVGRALSELLPEPDPSREPTA